MLLSLSPPFVRAVELSPVDASLETGPGPGNRKHRGDESGRADTANSPVCGQPDQRGKVFQTDFQS